MEITIYCLVFVFTLFFSYLTYQGQHIPWAYAVIAGIGFMVLALGLGEISYIVPNSVGVTWVDVSAGNSHTAGLQGLIYLFFLAGIMHLLSAASWVIMGEKTGSEI
jgi:amino acid transporter